ncbi:hypothetical protein ACWGOQ_0023785 [Aquimarina sp. M1]
MFKNELIKDLKPILSKIESKTGDFYNVLLFLSEKYILENNNLIVVDYILIKDFFSITFKRKEQVDCFFLELGNDHIRLRFLSIEEEYYYENMTDTNIIYKILDNFFEGRYKVEVHRNKMENPIYYKLQWDNNELKQYNSEYRFKKENISKNQTLKGINFLE